MTNTDPEAAIIASVRNFYGQAQKDPILGPIFAAKVRDWEVHYQVVSNFWSHFLLGTDRYGGHPFPMHATLPVEPGHFDRWLALFTVATKDHLPPDLAARALARPTRWRRVSRLESFRSRMRKADRRASQHEKEDLAHRGRGRVVSK